MRQRSVRPAPRARSWPGTTPALVLIVVLAAALAGIWGLAGAVGSSRDIEDPDATRAWLASEALTEARHWEGLTAGQAEAIREDLQQQLDAMGPEPSQSARERAVEEADDETQLVQDSTVTDPQRALLSTARELLDLPAADRQQRAVNVSAAAYRAAVAVDLGADPGSATSLVPEPAEEAASAVTEGPAEDGSSPAPSDEPAFGLASALAGTRFAAQTWEALPEGKRPRPGDWSRSLDPVLDGAWLRAMTARSPGVVSGQPSMPAGFRSEPGRALDRLMADLADAAAAQILDAGEDPRASAPGEAVLLRAVVTQVRVRGIDAAPGDAAAGLEALPGLETG